MLHDLRLALRTLTRNRAFAFAAVATLTLGIGANSAIFSIVNAVFFRPLPYPSAERVVAVWETKRDLNPNQFPDPKSVAAMRKWLILSDDFVRWEKQQRCFEALSGFTSLDATLTGDGEPERIPALAVTPGFFDLAGAKPLLGRVFGPDENRQGNDAVVLLSHGLWQRRFGSDPKVLGRSITIDGSPHTIIGVLPAGFVVLPARGQLDLVLPMEHAMRERGTRRYAFFNGAARLRPGVSIARAQSEMDAIAARLEAETPRTNRGSGVLLVPMREEIAGDVKPALFVLLGAVGCVLLIACANVANLLLARAAARRREIGLRTVLGAGRAALARQVLAESVVLALAGGAAGVLLARWGVSAIVALMPEGLIPRVEEIALDWRVASFAFLISLLTGVALGLISALQSLRWCARGELSRVLNQGGARSGGTASRRLRRALVVAEVAVTLVLLAGAGLLINSFVRLRGVDPGFRPANLLTMHLPLSQTKYRDAAQRAALADQLLERIQSLPAVESAASTNSLPLATRGWTVTWGLEIEGRPETEGSVNFRTVSPDYFRTIGARSVRGRMFTAADAKGDTVIMNEAMVRRFWPGLPRDSQEPLGRRVRFGGRWREIIGVVSDIKFQGLDSETSAEAYVPHTEHNVPGLALVVRTGSDPMRLLPAIRGVVRSVDPDQPIESIATMEDLIAESVARPRFHTLVVSAFAGLALALAAVGIYGVISYSVTQRTHEIGVRIALGAGSGRVLFSVVSEAFLLALGGVGLGILGAFGATRVLSKFLFGVRPTDPFTFTAVSLVLLAVAAAAGYIPARRASTVDPMVALRYE
jgi:putative ABC transport system permease protein